jgi:hypothetical protein
VSAGEHAVSKAQVIRDQRGPGDQIAWLFPSERAQIVKQYAELAEPGYAVIAAHLPEAEGERRSWRSESPRVLSKQSRSTR